MAFDLNISASGFRWLIHPLLRVQITIMAYTSKPWHRSSLTFVACGFLTQDNFLLRIYYQSAVVAIRQPHDIPHHWLSPLPKFWLLSLSPSLALATGHRVSLLPLDVSLFRVNFWSASAFTSQLLHLLHRGSDTATWLLSVLSDLRFTSLTC